MKMNAAIVLFSFIGLTAQAQVSVVKDYVYCYDFITELNGKLLFFATDELDANYELWVSDGTNDGTHLLKDINGTLEGSILSNSYWGPQYSDRMPYIYNNEMYFLATDGMHGMEIWKTDGTEAGTVMLKDIYPGINGFMTPYFYYPYFTELDGILYFAANDGVHGWELWKTNGTEGGTEMVVDISADGLYGSNPEHLINFNGTLIFTARDDVYGYEIYKSDGTEAGTEMIKDIVPGIYGSMNDGYAGSIDPLFTVSGGYLYFIGRIDESLPVTFYLYRTDGTDAGTITLNNDLENVTNFCDVDGTCYFYAFDGDYEHSSLWMSTGLPAETEMVATDGISASSLSSTFYEFNGKLYFYGYTTSLTEFGLAKSDGTLAGTQMVTTFDGLASVPEVFDFNRDGDSPYFFYHALKKVSDIEMSVRMVETNGTTAGTVVFPGVKPFRSTAFLNGDLYFPGIDTTGSEIWSLYKLEPVEIEVNIENENNSLNALSVFPNPSSNQITISTSGVTGNDQFTIYDITGRMIYSGIYEGKTQIDVSEWDGGVYFIRSTGESNLNGSFVIAR